MLQLITWIIYWFIIWGIFNFLKKRDEISYIRRRSLTVVFFTTSSLIASLLFLNIEVFIIYLGIAFVILCFALFFLVNKDFQVFRFISTKIFDIIFQQIMIFALIDISLVPEKDFISVIIATLIFGIVHIPLIFLSGEPNRYFLILTSFVGGFILISLILYLGILGIVLAFLMHISFYIYMNKEKLLTSDLDE